MHPLPIPIQLQPQKLAEGLVWLGEKPAPFAGGYQTTHFFYIADPAVATAQPFVHWVKDGGHFSTGIDMALEPLNGTPIYAAKHAVFLKPGLYQRRMGFLLPAAQGAQRVPMGHEGDNMVILPDIPVSDDPSLSPLFSDITAEKLAGIAQMHQLNVVADEKGWPCVRLERGAMQQRVAALSLPKAGTYLTNALLRRLGFFDSGLHVSLRHLNHWGGIIDDDFKPRPILYLPLVLSEKLVQAGQFVVGHVLCCDESAYALRNFRRLMVVRDLRDCMVSSFRFRIKRAAYLPRNSRQRYDFSGLNDENLRPFFARWLADSMQTHIEDYSAPLAWLDDPLVFIYSFEQMQGDSGADLSADLVVALAQFVGLSLTSAEALQSLKDIIGAPTRTFSGSRSSRDAYWSDEAEAIFLASGLAQIDARIKPWLLPRSYF